MKLSIAIAFMSVIGISTVSVPAQASTFRAEIELNKNLPQSTEMIIADGKIQWAYDRYSSINDSALKVIESVQNRAKIYGALRNNSTPFCVIEQDIVFGSIANSSEHYDALKAHTKITALLGSYGLGKAYTESGKSVYLQVNCYKFTKDLSEIFTTDQQEINTAVGGLMSIFIARD